MGALYVLPKYRGRGFMQIALANYLRTHKRALVWIDSKNHVSQALFEKLGFVKDNPKNFNDWAGHYFIKD